jgi:N-acetylglucosamine kinase-like BadF-type ATPase
LFLGVDVGGTHCRHEWWPAGAAPGGEARGVQPSVHGIDVTVPRLAEALAAATHERRPAAAVCALAGAGDERTSEAIAAGLRAAGITFPVAIVGDVLAAAAAALADAPGVLIWSGTGSFAVARGADGQLHRAGGRGYLLGDQGSGYDLVRRAAAAVLLAADQLGPATALTEPLTTAFRAPAPARLGASMQRLDTAEIAAKLPLLIDIASRGDAVAREVLEAGADGLAMLAAGAVSRAGLDWRELPVAIGGGVLVNAPAFAELLAARLLSFGGGAPRALDERAPARAAAWLANEFHHRREPAFSWVQRVAI